MARYLDELCLNSNRDNKWQHHVPGNIVLYKGKDGLKYYMILAREDCVQPATQYYGDYEYVKLTTAMVANPFLDINARAQKREFTADSVRVLNINEWPRVQAEFMNQMIQVGRERLAKFQSTNK